VRSAKRESALGWKTKRQFVPGGVESVFDEMALSAHQVSLVTNPELPTMRVVRMAPEPNRAASQTNGARKARR
jgi:hypothetical protein